MREQRKRVRVENTKFNQQAEEQIVDGEVAFDEDIMRELRQRKEDSAGPGDDFAKDTRKYNKEFAATHEPLEKYVPPDYSEFDDEDEDNNDLLSSEARAADKANAAAAAAKALKEKAAKLKKLFERSPDSGDDDNLPQ
eukprot:2553-Heterococcus_DN1.PRE.2